MKKYFLIAFIFLSVLTNAQEATDLSDYQFSKLHENVVLITDKDLYLAGEQVWFSCFYTQNGQLSSIDLSKVIYLELFNAKKDIIWQGKFSIDKAQSSGKIDIPSEIFSGTYFLRAYTQLQKNYSPQTYFTKAFQIINPSVPLPAGNQTPGDEITISPAGGILLQNTENHIALRIGNGLAALLSSIWLSDQFGNHIVEPVIYKNGLGYLTFTPVDTLQYSIKMTFSDGDTISKKLPASSNSGLVLFIKNERDRLKINISEGNSQADNSKKNFHLKIISEEKQEILDTLFSGNEISLKASLFESTIYLCEISDGNKQTLAKQYFTGQIAMPVKVLMQTNKQVYMQREKVELTIENNSAHSILSIAVTERGTNNLDPNLLPKYLVDNPILIPFYLETSQALDSAAIKQLEIILQLNSFPFKNIFSGKTVTYSWPPETSDVNIIALLRNKKSKEPIVGRIVYVSVLGSEPQLHVNRSQTNGKVYFSLTHSTDAKDVFICAESKNDEEIELLVLNDFSSEIPDIVDVPLEIDTTFRNQLEENWKTLQVENQYKVLEKLKTEEKLPPPARFSKPDYHVETKDFIELSNVEEMFKEIIPYTRLKKKSGNYYFEVMDPAKNAVYDNPLILVDDVPLFNYNSLANLPFSIIESVDVYAKQYVYGDFVFNGIVIIKSKTDNFAGLFMPYASVFAVYKMITPEVIIEFPDYSTDSTKQSRLPDFRTMLFWKPVAVLNENKKNFTFYTSNHDAVYDVVINGFTPDGKHCFGKSSFSVVTKKTD